MTLVLTTRDALVKALAAMEPGWASVQSCTPDQIGWTSRQGYLLTAQAKADALLASGALTDAAALAHNEGPRQVLSRWDIRPAHHTAFFSALAASLS